jgi:NTE family protein
MRSALLLLVGAVFLQRRNDILKATPKIETESLDNVLILGSGGILGIAWHAATLSRMQQEGLWDMASDNLRIGTSAGSLVAVALGAGITPELLLEITQGGTITHQGLEISMPDMETTPSLNGPRSNKWYTLKSVAKLRLPYTGLMFSSLRREGEVELEAFANFVDTVTQSQWPQTHTWVTSVEQYKGKRYIFNKDSSVSPGFAVAASCAVPSLYKPLTDQGLSFVDGGVISTAHIDLALRLGAKRIVVLAPLSGFVKVQKSADRITQLKQISRNMQEIALLKAQVKAKARGVELVIVRPRPNERMILNQGRLMDMSLLPELIKNTQATG